MRIPESELIINGDGSVFHIHLKPEELADNVIMVGDPSRVDMIGEYLTDIEFRHESREFVSITGKRNGKRITATIRNIDRFGRLILEHEDGQHHAYGFKEIVYDF